MGLLGEISSTLIPIAAATQPSAGAISRVDVSALDSLASASLSFLVASVILSFLVSVILEVTSDLGIRRLVNSIIVKRFVQHGPYPPIRIPPFWSGIYALAYDELAGQFASWVRIWSDEFLRGATPAESSPPEPVRRDIEIAERRVDRLHTKLRTADKWLSVLIPLLVTLVVIHLIYDSLASARSEPVVAVALMASLMSPFMRDLLRKFVRV